MQENTMHLPKGYMGKVLFVDLDLQTYHAEPLAPDLAARFLGGRGLGIAFLFQHFSRLEQNDRYRNAFAEVDPLSPDNPLIIATAPTTGTKMPTSGRFHANFKSPLTEGLGSSDSGGYWGVALKKTGYDVLYITGKADTPIYLVISSAGVEFHTADRFREANTRDTTNTLAAELPQGARVLTIGQAGKLGAYFASITNDKGRSLGRGGGGAVFGAKNLYAIAVVPDRSITIEVADEESLDFKNESGAAFKAKIKLEVGKFSRKEEHYGSLSSMGSLCLCGMVNNYGQLVHNNMRDTYHKPEDIERITGEALRQHAAKAKPGVTKVKVKKGTCYSCPILCKRKTQLIDGEGNLIDEGEGPEFETVALLGANLSIYNLPVIVQANYWANRYGVDTISLGGTIAAFIELYEYVKSQGNAASSQEKQLLEDTKTFIEQYGEPAFGNADILAPLVHEIGNLRGIGKYLASGSYRFCERYGHPEFSMTIKKQEMPAYDPRTSFTQALGYEMSHRGACHLEGGYTAAKDYCAGYAEWPGDRIEGSALISKNAAFSNTVLDIIGACVYSSFSITLDEYALLVNAVTGLSYNAGLLQKTAWRTLTLERLFNIRCGFTKNDDWLPARFFEIPVDTGERIAVCNRDAFEQMHQEYYQSLGWDEEGIPTQDTIHKLELQDFV
ncbi:aldehyde ferredoxin oxidoreductase [Candidatus Vecturithrix granuli]|uniref:Aldehyde ferredoxin oxidoreductase n=1 Tax=Vecturithrix granuli TaxID=1499967 RepID=A0A081BYQ4_VECG1|nr:aldehyde ferredoxin oxidoreductase [Candidatus Vecturithrix granuli]